MEYNNKYRYFLLIIILFGLISLTKPSMAYSPHLDQIIRQYKHRFSCNLCHFKKDPISLGLQYPSVTSLGRGWVLFHGRFLGFVAPILGVSALGTLYRWDYLLAYK